jgi:hypothetical protein
VDDNTTQSHILTSNISAPSMSIPPPYSVPSSDSFKSQLITLLGVDSFLTGSGDVSLPVAYQKYKAFLSASQTLDTMVANKTWAIKRPTKSDLIELFVSKSFFHSHYRRNFPKVAGYPEMVAWLEEKPDCLSNIDVWGIHKRVYTFGDLSLWLDNGGTLAVDDDYVEMEMSSKGRKKGKDKEKGSEKGKEKKMEKEKDKERKKNHKKKESSKQAK